MWAYKVVGWLKFVFAFSVALCVFACVCAFNLSAFPFEEDKEYYLYSASSQAKIVDAVKISDLPYIKGERVRVQTREGEGFLQAALEKYAATILKTENFDDGVCYYCYSPKLKNQMLLDGKVVNLHIVVKKSEVVMGTPIVFGGF